MKNIIDFFKFIIEYDKKLVMFLIGDILFGALQPFPKIVLSKIIFDNLVDGKSIGQFLFIISLFVVSDVVIQYIFHIFEQQVELKGQWLMFKLSYKLNRKTMELEYEMLLNPQVLEERELGLKVVSGSNFIDMIRSIRRIISNVIVIIGVVLIVMQVGFYVLIPVILVVALHFIHYMNLQGKNQGEKMIENKEQFTIEFSHVYFQYPGSENYVLEDLCCHFRNDEKIMVVGANGAGKTTFIHLLLRLTGRQREEFC